VACTLLYLVIHVYGYFTTVRGVRVVHLVLNGLLASFLELLHGAMENILHNGCKWQSPISYEDKVIRFGEVGSHDAVPRSMLSCNKDHLSRGS
jgi:hypothetical protein